MSEGRKRFGVVDAVRRNGTGRPYTEDSTAVVQQGDLLLCMVADGVSPITGSMRQFAFGGLDLTGGAWLAQQARRFTLSLRISEFDSALQVMCAIDAHIRSLIEERDEGYRYANGDKWGLPAAAMFILLINEKTGHFSWAQAADVLGFTNKPEISLFAPSPELKAFDIDLAQQMQKDGVRRISENQRIESLLRTNFKRRNITYAVVDGALNLDLVRHDHQELLGDQEFLVVTDGLYFDSDEPLEPAVVLQKDPVRACDRPLNWWMQQVLQREAHNPKCDNPLRVKPSDDKAGLLIGRR